MNYDEMTNAQLSWEVAGRLGWRLESLDGEYGRLLDPGGGSIIFSFVVPEEVGRVPGISRARYTSCDGFADMAEQCSRYAPQYASDLNVAIELVPLAQNDAGDFLHLAWDGEQWTYHTEHVHVSHASLARVICLAYLRTK
jgi:hypothetical protein